MVHDRDASKAFIQEEPDDRKALPFQAVQQIGQEADDLPFGQDKAQGQRHPASHSTGHTPGDPLAAGRVIPRCASHLQPLTLRLFAVVPAIVKIARHLAHTTASSGSARWVRMWGGGPIRARRFRRAAIDRNDQQLIQRWVSILNSGCIQIGVKTWPPQCYNT